jgi:hypothetical protein
MKDMAHKPWWKWWCDHLWIEIGRAHVPPRDVTSGGGSFTPEEWRELHAQMERISSGSTVVELRCSACGDVSSRVMLGDHTMKSKPGQ